MYLMRWLESLLHSRSRTLKTRSRRRACASQAEQLERKILLTTFLVDSTADAGMGTLRQAIEDANANPGSDTIEFGIDGAGVHTIDLASGLPQITDTVVVNATTQPGYAGTPVIELVGANAGVGASGLVLAAGSDGSVIRGLVINRFDNNGIQILSNGNIIAGNYIGTDSTGTVDLGNAGSGILLGSGAAGHRIGSDNEDPAEANVIAFNGSAGVATLSSAGSGNRIIGNAIYANTGLGIDFNLDGITFNDAGDGDNGPNDLQNFPVLASAHTVGTTSTNVIGSFDSLPNATYTLDFYANTSSDPSGHGEGERFLGSTTVTTDSAGFASFTALVGSATVGEFITATATSADGSTSEFSQNVIVVSGPDNAGTSLQFDGVDDFVEVPNSPALHSDRQLTIEGWFNIEDLEHRTWHNLLVKGNVPDASEPGGSQREFGVWVNSAGYLFFASTPSDRIGVGQLSLSSASDLIRSHEWHHFAGVVDADAGSMQLYLDGVLVGTRSYNTVGIRETLGPLRFGLDGFMPKGQLDEMRIWNVARTENQIQAQMHRQLTGGESGLMGYWRFDETSGETVTDLSGNGNHGGFTSPGYQQGVSGRYSDSPSYHFYKIAGGKGAEIAVNLPEVNTTVNQYNTVSFWMHWNGANGVMPVGFTTYDLYLQGGAIGFNTGQANIYGTSYEGLSNRWVHVTAAFANGDATQSRLWIDGVEQTLSDQLAGATTQPRTATADARISGWTNDGIYRFGGKLDEVAFFNRLLSDGEIQTQFSASSAANYRAVLSGQSPMAHYGLDELTGTTALDLSGNGRDGTILGIESVERGVSGAIAGDANTAMEFGGSTEHGVHVQPFDFPETAFSAEVWVKTTATNDAGLISYAVEGQGNESLLFRPWNLQIYINGPSVTTGVSVNDGLWHHLVVTWQSSDGALKLYKDGELAFSTTHQVGNPITPGGALVLAQEQDSVGGGFQSVQSYTGALDEFALYPNVLSASEVAAHFNAGTDGLGNYDATVLADSPRIYWRLGETEGGLAVDSSGNENHGRIGTAPVRILSTAPLYSSALGNDEITLAVTTTADSGPGSLRQAILDAHLIPHPNPVNIVFDIPATDANYIDVDSALPGGDADPDVFVISLATALPVITRGNVTIDGRTQADTNPFGPEIVLNGTLVNGSGLVFYSSNNQAHGLNIQSFNDSGIAIAAGSENWVSGNYIGVDATGTTDRAMDLPATPPEGSGANAVFHERNGLVVVEAEQFQSRTSFNGADWLVVPDESGGVANFANARGGYIQVLPDVGQFNGNSPPFGQSPSVRYTVHIDTPGEYQLFSRFDGMDQNSDSLYASIVELRDGVGAGQADWYRFGHGPDADFGTDSWHGVGESEGTSVSGNNIPAVWNITEAGDYTIEFLPREDGIALDAFVLQLTTRHEPESTGNALDGVRIAAGASDNLIGTNGDGVADQSERNVIAANGRYGVYLVDAGTDRNFVAGNYIGIDATGTVAFGNTLDGIRIDDRAAFNLIGTNSDGIADADERNVISGNMDRGIFLFRATDNKIAGNFIGTDFTGTTALGNLDQGVYIHGASARNILGTEGDGIGDAVEGNIVSANGPVGVFITNASHENIVAGNLIGTDVTGTVDLGNGGAGAVRILNGAHHNRIGTDFDGVSDEIERNVISGNTRGVQIDDLGTTDNVVAGNFIGTDITGEAALGNDTMGVWILEGAQRNIIDRNVISGNDQQGVLIQGTASSTFPVFQWTTGPGANGHYYVLSPSTNWIDAENTAVRMGGHLASVTSAEEQAFLESVLLSNNENFWLGLGDQNDEGNFTWTTGEPVTYTNWNSGQPDDWPFGSPEGEDFTVFQTNGGWNDTSERSRFRGVIELESSPDLALLDELMTTRENRITGNFIGTTADGKASLGNGSNGVQIDSRAQANIIGTNGDGLNDDREGNVVSGNLQVGVQLSHSGTEQNVVAGNLVGTSQSGTLGIANAVHGIRVSAGASRNVIGTNGDGVSDSEEGNLISGNAIYGVEITGAGTENNWVAGNRIGTDITGTAALANGAVGLTVEFGAQFNRVGTNGDGIADKAERNIISGNLNTGVRLLHQGTSDNTVAGNFIGTDASGTASLGNSGGGVAIWLGAQGNLIGSNGDGQGDTAERNVISGNMNHGVWISGADTDNNTVAGNLIGTDVTGTLELGNSQNGVHIVSGASHNLIGTDGDGIGDEAEQNVISGNTSRGIVVSGLGTDENVVAGNLIGTDATGLAALGNGAEGVYILNQARSNRIGTNADGVADAAERNVISGNGALSAGVAIGGVGVEHNVVAGNYIGTDARGLLALANGGGMIIFGGAQYNRVGSNGDGNRDAAERNLISGNRLQGINIRDAGSDHNLVAGNLIGTDVTGTRGLGNGQNGVGIHQGASSNRIGGTTPAQRNVVSGNGAHGVVINGSSFNSVQGNFIGTDVMGSTAIANAHGVSIAADATGNLIGGDSLAERNLISGNTNSGVVIDGSANTISANIIGLAANGNDALGNGQNGVLINGDGNVIGADGDGTGDALEGNIISGNLLDGVQIFAAANNVVAGNRIGTNAAGTLARGNGSVGIFVRESGATGNRIGTDGDGQSDGQERNLISGNATGVQFTNADDNVLAGNFIGTDWAGTDAIGNRFGIWVNHSDNIRIGTNADGQGDADERNVISGNLEVGVDVSNTSQLTTIAGNFIGVGADGTAQIGNGLGSILGLGYGIWAYGGASNLTIGGTMSAERNVISGNTRFGIKAGDDLFSFGSATDVAIAGNYIGTDVSGTLARGNGQVGIYLADGDNIQIGGGGPGEGNVISANAQSAMTILAESTGTVVQGNLVGTDRTGTLALGNGQGIVVHQAALIGTDEDGVNDVEERNLIANSSGSGVVVSNSNFSGVTIRQNSIHSNAGLGIDLGDDGVTTNGVAVQDYPVITTTVGGSNTRLVGTVQGPANSELILDFFAITSVDGSRFGEGRRFLVSHSVPTNATGSGAFDITLSGVTTLRGESITATATSPDGTTSEFSQAVETVFTQPPTITGDNLIVTAIESGSEGETAAFGTVTRIVPENQTFHVDGLFESPDPDDVHTVTVDWGDGSSETTTIAAGLRGFSFEHVYEDDALTGTSADDVTVVVTVTEADGASGSASIPITVENVAPTIGGDLVLAPTAIDEGETVDLSGTIEDPGLLDTHTVTVNWGDGSPDSSLFLAAGLTDFSFSHTYQDDNHPATTPITVTLTDDDGGLTELQTQLDVANVAPEARILGTEVSVLEGDTVSLMAEVSDPGLADTHTYEWAAMLAGAVVASGTSETFQFIPPDSGNYTVSLVVTDDDGAASNPETASLLVQNVAPVIEVGDVAFQDENGNIVVGVGEGSPVTISGTFADPGIESHTVAIDWADGTALETLVLPAGVTGFSATHTYEDDPEGVDDNYPVSILVTDADFDQDTVVSPVTIANVAPIPQIIDDGSDAETIRLRANVTDDGADNFVYAWTVTDLPAGIPTDQPTISFPRPTGGVAGVALIVTDDDGGSARTEILFVGGSDAGDTINITPTEDTEDDPGALSISVTSDTGTSAQDFAPVDAVLVSTGAGDDVLTVEATVNTPLSVLAGEGNDSITSGGGNDFIDGGPGNDTVLAGEGNDIMTSEGNDDLSGEAGDDVYIMVGFSDKTLREGGGDGIDTINFALVSQGVSLDLGERDTAQTVTAEDDTLTLTGDFENLIGSEFDDSFTGNELDNVVDSGGGDDLIFDAGGNDSFVGGGGDDSITGGDGNDIYDGGDGNDTIINGGGNDTTAGDNTFIFGGDDTIFGGEGNDLIFDGEGNDSYSGGGGDDSIMGSEGNDVYDGGDGDDTIMSGGNDTMLGDGDETIFFDGDDTIFGGEGNDLIFDGGGNDSYAGGGGDDSIMGGAGNDIYDGGDGDDTIVSGDMNDTTFFDGDDTIFGGEGNDLIFDGEGNDSYAGGGGDDSIIGGGGNDIYDGGDGDDTIMSGGGNDTNFGDGDDTIFGGEGNDLIFDGEGNDSYAGGGGDDSIVGGGGNDVYDGGDGDDTIVSGGGNDTTFIDGDDTIFGGEGNDLIFDGEGNDSYSGGGGDDTIVSGGGNDTTFASGDDTVFGGEGNDLIFDGEGNDSYFGGAGDDTIYAGGGNDTTFASGDDTVFGGEGNDLIFDGEGNDSYSGGAGDDTIMSGGGNDITFVSGDDTVFGGEGNDLIFDGEGNDSYSGGGGDDTIYAGGGNDTTFASGDDTVFGGEGNDLIFDGEGNDSYSGGGGNDTIHAGGGNDTTFASGDDTVFGGEGNDLIFDGEGNDSYAGGGGDDTIFAGSGNDTSFGGGNDTIFGGEGNDLIFDGEGNDSYSGGGGNDTIVGGDGNDVYEGGDGNDSITGSEGNDTLDGGAGNDTVRSGDGDDTIFGGEGNDLIFGGAASRLIDAGTGNDVVFSQSQLGTETEIFGNDGSDTIVSGDGDETVFGGEGDNDWLVEFASRDALLDDTTLTADGVTTFSGIEKVQIVGGDGDNLLDASAFSGDAVLIGGAGDDTLLGGSGDDTLNGGAGDDFLDGGMGDDTYVFDADSDGNDTIAESAGAGSDMLDFGGFTEAITLDLGATGTNTTAGNLTLTIMDSESIEDVTGTLFSDEIIGNSLDNKLFGGGGRDYLSGGDGHDIVQASITKVVFLDFDSQTGLDEHDYTPEERLAIQERIEADFADFDFAFTQSEPVSGPFVRVLFNATPLIGGRALPGGRASQLGWRIVDLSGTVIVDVNGFLGGANGLAPTSQNFVALSSTIAAHELGHQFGLRHHDAFGALGGGIYDKLDPGRFLPDYPGLADADQTRFHLLASPGSVGTSLVDAAGNPFFGNRERIKLAFAETGTSLEEVEPTADSPQITIDGVAHLAQDLGELAVLSVPISGQEQNVAAVNVVGSIELFDHDMDENTPEIAESDFYAFQGQEGELVTVEILSASLDRIGESIDSVLRIYGADGRKIEYYGSDLDAFNDDNLELTDSILLDVVLPEGGTFFIEVDTFRFRSPEFSSYLPDFDVETFESQFPGHPGVADNDDGDYEMFLYRTRALSADDLSSDDTLVGGAGDDTLIGSSGRDQVVGFNALEDILVDRGGAATFTSGALSIALEQTMIDEGKTANLSGELTGGGNEIATINWGDGQESQVALVNGRFTASHIYGDDQPGSLPDRYTIQVTMSDPADPQNELTAEAAISVRNVAPQNVDAGENRIQLTQGLAISFTSAFEDVAADQITTLWSLFDPSGQLLETSNDADFGFTPADNGIYLVELVVADDDGGVGTDRVEVYVVNAPPQNVAVGGQLRVSEGDLVDLTVTFDDASSDTHTISWQVDAGNGQVVPGGSGTSFQFTPNDNGFYTVTVTVTDDEGASAQAAVLVIALNVAPTLMLPPDATIEEGALFTGLGTFDDPGADTWTATVDYGDGSGVQPLTLNLDQSFELNHVYQTAGEFTVTVNVTDDENATGTSTLTVTVLGTAPVLTAQGPATGVRGQSRWLTFSVNDGVGEDFDYRIDWDGDGTIDQIVENAGAVLEIAHIYENLGTFTVQATAVDSLGRASEPITHEIDIRVVDIQQDPWNENASAVAVGGSVYDDSISFLRLGDDGVVVVILTDAPGGFQLVTAFVHPVAEGFELSLDFGDNNLTVLGVGITPPIGRLLAFGQAGDDVIRVSAFVGFDSILSGDLGNDILVGGYGDNVLLGGEGNDLLFGGNGRDVLIGGDGRDTLVGRNQEDLLIAGIVAFDNLDRAIRSIAETWTDRTVDYADRVAALSDPNSSYSLVDGQTVFDDDDADILLGGNDLDWYLGKEDDDVFFASLDEIFTEIDGSILDI